MLLRRDLSHPLARQPLCFLFEKNYIVNIQFDLSLQVGNRLFRSRLSQFEGDNLCEHLRSLRKINC